MPFFCICYLYTIIIIKTFKIVCTLWHTTNTVHDIIIFIFREGLETVKIGWRIPWGEGGRQKKCSVKSKLFISHYVAEYFSLQSLGGAHQPERYFLTPFPYYKYKWAALDKVLPGLLTTTDWHNLFKPCRPGGTFS